jgi:hypothetical protein
MKDRFDRAKRLVSDHKADIAFGAGAVAIGVVVGSKLRMQHTFLTITEQQLRALITDPKAHMVWDAAGRHTIHLVNVP